MDMGNLDKTCVSWGRIVLDLYVQWPKYQPEVSKGICDEPKRIGPQPRSRFMEDELKCTGVGRTKMGGWCSSQMR